VPVESSRTLEVPEPRVFLAETSWPMRENSSRRFPVRTAVVLLLFAVAGLSTVSKSSKYLPHSNPLHCFAKQAKMNVADHPVHFIPTQAYLVSGIVPPQPEFMAAPQFQSEGLALRRIDLAASSQHRAPPSVDA